MKPAKVSIVLAAVFGSSQALAGNWVTHEGPLWFRIDKDTIRRGNDNLVYYRSQSSMFELDNAVDCKKRVYFTLKRLVPENLKQYMPEDTVYPNWRNDGRAVVPGSVGEAELQYVCANA